MDKETLESCMRGVKKDCKDEDMKFSVLRRIRDVAQARERKQRLAVRTVCTLLFVFSGWLVIRSGNIFPEGLGTLLDTVGWLFRGSLILLCGIFAFVFTLSFQAREKG